MSIFGVILVMIKQNKIRVDVYCDWTRFGKSIILFII
jgi:hypothetical protein